MAETAAPPRPEAGKKPDADSEKIRIVLNGLDKSAEAFGREAAHNEASKNPEGPAWRRVVKSAWNNLTHEYQIVQKTQEKTEAIYEHDNVLHHYGQDDKSWREATADRYASEYGHEMLRDGETFHRLQEDGNENAQRVRGDIIDLATRRANGDIIDDASMNAELERMAREWASENISQEYIGEGRILGSNLSKMVGQVNAMVDAISGLSDVERRSKVEEIMSKAEVIVGEAKMGSETEIEATVAERLSGKLKKVPFLSEGKLAKVAAAVSNETVIAGAISVAAYGASRAASLAMAGLGGGGIAAIRERSKLRAERALAERRRYMGAETTEMPDDSTDSNARKFFKKAGIGVSEEQRRAEMDATLYNTIPADEAIASIGGYYSPEGDLMITNADQFKAALTEFGRLKAHADRQLFSVADVEVEEKAGRAFEAQVAVAKFEADLRKLYGDDIARGVLDLEEGRVDADLADATEIQDQIIKGDIDAKDALMAKLARTRIMQRGLLGAGAGAAANELVDALGNVFSGSGGGGNGSNPAPDSVSAGNQAPNQVGGNPAPGVVDGGGNQAPDSVGGNPAPDAVDGSNRAPDAVDGGSNQAPSEVDGGGNRAPESVDGSNQAPDSVDSGENQAPGAVDSGNNQAPGEVDSGGNQAPSEVDSGADSNPAPGEISGEHSVDTETHEISDSSDINMPSGYEAEVDGSQMTITTPDGKTINGLEINEDGSLTGGAQDKLKANGLKLSDHVNIVQGEPEVSHLTVSPNEFVKNHTNQMTTIGHREWVNGPDEFQLQNRLNSDGSITVDVSGMANSQWSAAAANGHMNIYMSASKGSSGHGFKLEIGPDGKAKIPADSPMRALFNSEGRFIGGYQEAAITGDAVNGAEHIAVLATAVGENKATITDTVTTQRPFATHSYTLSDPGVDINADNTFFSTNVGGSAADIGLTAPLFAATTAAPRRGIGQPGVSVTPGSAGGGPGSGPTPESGAAPGPEPEPEPEPTPGPEATPDPDGYTASERATMNALDLEALNMEDAFKFAGYEGYGEREQKMAMQLIGIARAEMGDTADPADLARRAQELADAYETTSTTNMAEFYARVSAFLTEAAAAAEQAAEEARKAREEQDFFDTLDSENLNTPSGYEFSGYETHGDRERKQAVRFIRQSISDIGDSDKLAVIADAISKLSTTAADPDLSAERKSLYAQSLGILISMQDKLTADAEAEARRKEEEEERKANAPGQEDGESDDSYARRLATWIDGTDHRLGSEYDFPGRARLGERASKMAAYLIKRAGATGASDSEADRVRFVDEAIRMANEEVINAGSSGDLRRIYADALKVLEEAAKRVKTDAESKESTNKDLDDLFEAMKSQNPNEYEFTVSDLVGYGSQAVKLAMQALQNATASITRKSGDSDEKFNNRRLRKASAILNGLVATATMSADQSDIFQKAIKLINSSRPMKEQESRNNPFGTPTP